MANRGSDIAEWPGGPSNGSLPDGEAWLDAWAEHSHPRAAEEAPQACWQAQWPLGSHKEVAKLLGDPDQEVHGGAKHAVKEPRQARVWAAVHKIGAEGVKEEETLAKQARDELGMQMI